MWGKALIRQEWGEENRKQGHPLRAPEWVHLLLDQQQVIAWERLMVSQQLGMQSAIRQLELSLERQHLG